MNRAISKRFNSIVRDETETTLLDWMYGGHERRSAKPVNETDFKKYFDQSGRLIYANELRQAIYEGGVDPSMRKLVWRYLLNIYPSHMTSEEQVAYLDQMKIDYEK